MKSTVSLTGADTFIFDGFVLTDVADGDWARLELDGSIVSVKIGKNDNMIYAENRGGTLGVATLRLLRGSRQDRILNTRMNMQLRDFAKHILINGTMTKRVGNGLGGVKTDTYLCSGGVFESIPGASSNAEGDTEQSVSVYRLRFKVQRAIF